MIEQAAVVLGPQRDDQLDVGLDVDQRWSILRAWSRSLTSSGRPGEREELLGLVDHQDQGVRQAGGQLRVSSVAQQPCILRKGIAERA